MISFKIIFKDNCPLALFSEYFIQLFYPKKAESETLKKKTSWLTVKRANSDVNEPQKQVDFKLHLEKTLQQQQLKLFSERIDGSLSSWWMPVYSRFKEMLPLMGTSFVLARNEAGAQSWADSRCSRRPGEAAGVLAGLDRLISPLHFLWLYLLSSFCCAVIGVRDFSP